MPSSFIAFFHFRYQRRFQPVQKRRSVAFYAVFDVPKQAVIILHPAIEYFADSGKQIFQVD
jgi:hypothetical protein